MPKFNQKFNYPKLRPKKRRKKKRKIEAPKTVQWPVPLYITIHTWTSNENKGYITKN